MQDAPKKFTRKEAARYIEEVHKQPCSVDLLNKKAVYGDGPKFRKASGRWVIYEQADLDAWANARLGPPVQSTSEAGSQLSPERVEAMRQRQRKPRGPGKPHKAASDASVTEAA